MYKMVTSNSTVIALHERLIKKNKGHVINSSTLNDKWLKNIKDAKLDKIRFLYVARVNPEKGIYEFLEIFKKIFTKLFNGGNAELKLIGSDDPLQSGLEIFASPPEKKMQSLSLLSGGEQALTSISLIFAVYLSNPSPLCILDEVDAALDDTNVSRFCDILKYLSDEQDISFLIVTHHRLTMAKMNKLLGVTMEEKGISKLLSVDLEKAVEIKEAS